MTEQIVYDFEFLDPPDTETPDVIVTDDIDAEFVALVEETARAKRYRKKISGALGNLWRPMLASPRTVPDAAAILQYGPDFARAVGKLADEDEKARKTIDFIMEGADNPYLNVLATGLPLVIQFIRNHERALEPEVRGFRIFGREFKFKIGFKLKRMHNLSHDPSELTHHVLGNPNIIEVLRKQGLRVAWNDATPTGANGTRKR